MRWILTGLLLLVLGSLFGLALSWPGGVNGVQRNGVSLSEFQRGARIDRIQVPGPQTPPDPPRPADPPGKPAVADIAMPAQKMVAQIPARTALPAMPADAGGNASQPRRRDQAADTVAPEPANAPGRPSDQSQSGVPSRTAPLPLQGGETTANPPPGAPKPKLATVAVIAAQGPADTLASDKPPGTGFPATPTGMAQAQPADVTPTGLASLTPASGPRGERISIHFHNDERSRMVGRRVLGKLQSAGLDPGTLAMHATAHVNPSPTVRYFSEADAPVAASLARILGTKKTVWRVEDCTACKRMPEAASVEIWLATADTQPK